MGDFLSGKSGGTMLPPADFAEMLLMLNTHIAELWVLFGGNCPQFLGLQEIATVMTQLRKSERKKITRAFCAQLTYVLMLYEWDFFDEQVTPAQWVAGAARLPQCLTTVILNNVLTREPIVREDFPPQWS